MDHEPVIIFKTGEGQNPVQQCGEKMEAEYGSVGNIKFINPIDVKMCDSDGKIILCKCGKPAGQAIMGKESYAAFCSDCSPTPKHEASFVYREPSEEQKKKYKQMGFDLDGMD